MNFAQLPYRFAARSVVIDGFRVAYTDTDAGSDSPVLFLHGIAGNLDWFADACERLSPDRLESLLRLHCELAHDLRHREWAHAIEAGATSMRDHALGERLGEIAAPALLICGIGDRIVPFQWATEALDAIAGSQIVALEHCGHLPMFEQPDAFVDAIAEFVTSGTVKGRAFASPRPAVTRAV